MKYNTKLFYSLDKVNPSDIYKLKLSIRKTKLKVEFMQWHSSPEEETKVLSFLLLTYRVQLAEQNKTIPDLGTPVLIWSDAEGLLHILVGYDDIIADINKEST
jgi:hypothetical protein